MAIRPNNVIKLLDGRSLGYDECGDSGGVAVLVFHGTLASRIGLAGPDQDEAAERLGVRLIAVDRPGHGLSDPKPGRTILDWPVDVLEFADALGLVRFNVLGYSTGAAYAAACAYRIAHRIWAAGAVCGEPPLDRFEDRAGTSADNRRLIVQARWAPWLLRRAVRKMAEEFATNPDQIIERWGSETSEADRRLLADPRQRQTLIDTTREAFRAGPDGPILDFKLRARSWGFALGDVPMVINLWFGEQDRTVSPAASRYLASAFRRSEARGYAGEGHLSLFSNRVGEILSGLLETARREDGRSVG